MDEILRKLGGSEKLWNMIQQNAEKVGMEITRTMLELFYVLKSPDTSMLDKSLIVAALAYQLLPEDVLSKDKYGLLGFLDNTITLSFAYNRVKSSVTPEIERQVNNIISYWFSVESKQQQHYIPNNDNPQHGGYSSQPVYTEPQQQVNPSYNGFQDNRPTPTPQKPIWDDDDEVVVD